VIFFKARANCIGEAAIGTNYVMTRFTKNMLFDEKMGGDNAHGAWELLPRIWRRKQIGNSLEKDGEIFCKNGKFLI
jgi:aminopeptidase